MVKSDRVVWKCGHVWIEAMTKLRMKQRNIPFARDSPCPYCEEKEIKDISIIEYKMRQYKNSRQ